MGEGPQRRGSDKDWCLANQLFMEPKETKAQRQVLNKEPTGKMDFGSFY